MRKFSLLISMTLSLVCGLTSLANANPAAPRWHRINNDGPSRREHKCAYDSRRNVVVLFGGMDSISVYDSAVWEWSDRWTRIDAPGPGARLGHGLCYDTLHHVTLLFGGRLEGGAYTNDFWSWDGSVWTQIQAEGPSPRGFFTFAYDIHRQRAVLFGGCYMGTIFGETWEWDGDNWTLTQTDGPPPRILSAMTFDYSRNQMVLFGGRPAIEEGFLGDTWALSDSGWVEVICQTSPTARAGHSMASGALFGSVLLYGGFDSDLGPLPYETWHFDGSDWFSVGLFENPEPRYFADMVYQSSADIDLLIGGLNHGDIWEIPYYVSHYVMGDVNDNGVFNGVDVSYSVNYFKGIGPPPPRVWELCGRDSLYVGGDVNATCSFNGIDVTYSVSYLKGVGPAPIPCPYCPPGF